MFESKNMEGISKIRTVISQFINGKSYYFYVKKKT